MSEFPPDIEQLTPLQRAALTIKQLRGRLDDAERARTEPIAVVGMGCRFPGGADDPASYWRLLRDGVDGISEVPRDRWEVDAYYDPDPDAAGKMYVRRGGFLARVDEFDARFFAIAPREAASMDPQQRLLLEVAWEALEDAGLAPEGLSGGLGGVFVGVTASDYWSLLRNDPGRLDAYAATGNSLNASAGRVSHVLGLQGPSMAVDTACSSSLVSVHLACQSLRAGECDFALAGGVNLILSPEVMVALCRARMLAPDGRCKTFDESADGYARGEGCGVVVLKRLADALKDGDRVVALIRGSAVNQDGPSGGFTVPNGKAQEALIRRALAVARVDPAEIDYLEAHGTGTALGDPIEVHASSAVLCENRSSEHPLIIGSAKANVGHLESAAGIAGLIKVVLCLQHKVIPRHLHFQRPNPHISWDLLAVQVARAETGWPARDRPRLAGINAFGASGTNAHLILQEATDVAAVKPKGVDRPLHILALSAKSETALRRVAERYRIYLDGNPEVEWADVCFSANTGRSHFSTRAHVTASTASQGRGLLKALASGEGSVRETDPSGPPRVAFLFYGQGELDTGMGRGLYETQPTFRRALDRCQEILRGDLERPLLDRLFAPEGPSIDTEPVLFALEYALCELWKSWGVRPAAVLGRGVGEYVAACVAGVFRLEDGLRLVVNRARSRFERIAEGVEYRPAEMTLVSGTTGEPATEEIATAGYWARQAREPARLADGIQTLRRRGFNAFVEVGPGRSGREILPDESVLWLAGDEWRGIVHSLGELYDHGFPIDWKGFDREYTRNRLQLPTYPWDRQRHWMANGVQATTSPEADSTTLRELREGKTSAIRGRLEQSTDFSAGEREAIPKVLEALVRQHESERSVDADRQLLYEVAWRPKPLPAQPSSPDFALSPGALCDRLRPGLPDLVSTPGYDRYRRVLERLEAISIRYVASAWREMGGPFRVGERFSASDLAERMGVIARHRGLLGRTAEMLEEEGFLHREGVQWEVVAEIETSDPAPLVDELLGECPEAVAELTMLGRCGAGLADVLRGGRNPLELLFPEGDVTTASHLYGDSPAARLMNRIARDAVALLIERCPDGRKLRVLEIGAGTGGTTSTLLPFLPPDRTDYLFTDISPRFTTEAREKYRDFPFVRTQVLDIERDPSTQGFQEGPFDLIVAANVLHATKNLRRTLQYTRQLAAPGAMLVLIEGTVPIRFIDLIFGMTDGWWRFHGDPDRRFHPLIPAARWQDLLGECGFGDVGSLALGEETWGVLGRQAVIVSKATEVAGIEGESAPRHWLILADRGGVGGRLGALHESRGGSCTLAYKGEVFRRSNENVYEISQDRGEDLRRLLEEAGSTPIDEIIHLWSLDSNAPDEHTGVDCRTGCGSVLNLVKSLAGASRPGAHRLSLVTRGAVAAGQAKDFSELAQSALWGLSRVTGWEHPELKPLCVDLDPAGSVEENVRSLWGEVQSRSGEDEVAFRAGARLVTRLTRSSPVRSNGRPHTVKFRDDASYLITGGLGGLGLLTARWLVSRGARSLALVGRRGVDEGTASRRSELERMGARVAVYQADVARYDEMERVFAEVEADSPPVRGVVHAAGVLDDGVMRQLSWERFDNVLQPKVAGAWNLHRLTADRELDFLVLYSSLTSIVGHFGQSSHAAANAFLDALAHTRRGLGLPALSINWGPWAEIGAAAEREVGDKMRSKGIGAISPEQGLRLLEEVWHSPSPQVAVAPITWSELAEQAARRPMMAGLVPANSTRPVRRTDVLERFRATAPRKRHALLVEHVRDEVARVLGLEGVGSIGPRQGFFELGMDSLTSVELRNRLSADLQRRLPTTLAFDHPTPVSLADFLLGELDDRRDELSKSEESNGVQNGEGAGSTGLDGLSVAEIEDLIDRELEITNR